MIENRIFDDASAAKGQNDSIIYKSDGQKGSARLHKISLLFKVIFGAIMKNIFRVSLFFIFLALSKPAQSQTDLTDLQIEQVRNTYSEAIQSYDATLAAERLLLDTMKSVNPTDNPNYIEAVDYYFKLLHRRASFQIGSARDKTFQEGLASIELHYVNNTNYVGKKYFKALFLLELFSQGYLQAVSTTPKLLDALRILEGISQESKDEFDFGSIGRLFARIPLAEKKVSFRPFGYKIADVLPQIDNAIGYNIYACENYLVKLEILRNMDGEKYLALVRAQAISEVLQFEEFRNDGILDSKNLTLYYENISCLKKLSSGKNEDMYSADRMKLSPVLENEYKVDVDVLSASITPLPPIVNIELYCDFWIGNKDTKPFKILSFNNSQNSSVFVRKFFFSLETRNVPCGKSSILVLFDAGLSTKATASFIPKPEFLRLTDEALVKSIENEFENKSISLIRMSFTLTSLILSQPNMYCVLRSAEGKTTIDPGFIKQLKSEYFRLFSESFDVNSKEYSCPPVTTLKKEVAKCSSPSIEYKSFCAEYREYLALTKWFDDSIKLINERIDMLNSAEKDFKEELEVLRKAISDEIATADETIGEEI
ncbi:MAG: hypothetical protein EOO46_16825 [Flavobacterium sp.]|nr:MAG: hypothetical protein EOO46_16825 [Flavobacterium sp.]